MAGVFKIYNKNHVARKLDIKIWHYFGFGLVVMALLVTGRLLEHLTDLHSHCKQQL